MKFDLVILDNISSVYRLEDETASTAFDPLLDLSDDLKRLGLACLIVHHSKKDGDKYRGHSKLGGMPDVIIGLKDAPGRSANDNINFVIQWEKYRNKPNPQYVREFTVGYDGEGKGWSYNGTLDEELQKIVDLVRSGQFASQIEVAEELGTSPSTLTRRKRAAVKAQLITDEEWTSCLSGLPKQDEPDF